MEVPLETDEQKSFIEWLRAMNIFHFAPTNENNTHKQNRKYAMIAEQKAKKMGKVTGVSDIIIFLPGTLLILEMKRKRKLLKSGKYSNSHSKPSKEQIDFQNRANKFDYVQAHIAYGAKEAIEITRKYLKK